MPANVSDKFLAENLTGNSGQQSREESSSEESNRLRQEERDMEKQLKEFVREQKKLDSDLTDEEAESLGTALFFAKGDEDAGKDYISVADHKKALEELKLTLLSELEARLLPYKKDAVEGDGVALNELLKLEWIPVGLPSTAGKSTYMVLQLNSAKNPIWDYSRFVS